MTTPSSARLLGKTRSVLKRDQSRGQKSRKSGSSIRQEFGLWTENEELIEFAVEVWTYNNASDVFDIITFKGNQVLNVESEKK